MPGMLDRAKRERQGQRVDPETTTFRPTDLKRLLDGITLLDVGQEDWGRKIKGAGRPQARGFYCR